MVKLIRLVNNEKKPGFREGFFDCEFDTEIKVEPKSKIALHSAVFESIEREFEIVSDNNDVAVTYDNSNTENVNLTSRTYDSDNIEFLFDDITTIFNNKTPFNSKFTGGEWLAHKQQYNNKVAIEYKRNQQTKNPEIKKNVSYSTSGGGSIKRNGGTSGTGDAIAGSDGYLARGCSTFWTSLISNTTLQPFFMGVMDDTIENKITGDVISIGDIKYGFVFDGVNNYQVINNGVAGTPVNFTSTSKWYFEFNIAGENINLNFWEGSQTNVLNLPYNMEKFYPVCVITGTNAMELNWRANISPFSSAVTEKGHDGDLTAPSSRPTSNTANNDNMNVIFSSDLLAQFLGYSYGNLGIKPAGGHTSNVKFEANNTFLLNTKSDSFIIEMLNNGLAVSAFDAQIRHRAPIIAVIPSAEISEIAHAVVYEAKNLIYLDMDNIDEQYIRVLKCRLLNSDRSPVLTKGNACITLLIKGPEE